jgi:hypothetical protein
VDELYVIARRVLLDALEALADHRSALILVGAQAIYLRTGEADLAVSPYTTDADLGIDPSVLSETPPLERALMQANFAPPAGGRVGIWSTARTLADGTEANAQVDLLVPRSLSPGTGRRAAKLKGHHELAARMVVGLEGVVVDFDVLSVGALGAERRPAFRNARRGTRWPFGSQAPQDCRANGQSSAERQRRAGRLAPPAPRHER